MFSYHSCLGLCLTSLSSWKFRQAILPVDMVHSSFSFSCMCDPGSIIFYSFLFVLQQEPQLASGLKQRVDATRCLVGVAGQAGDIGVLRQVFLKGLSRSS